VAPRKIAEASRSDTGVDLYVCEVTASGWRPGPSRASEPKTTENRAALRPHAAAEAWAASIRPLDRQNADERSGNLPENKVVVRICRFLALARRLGHSPETVERGRDGSSMGRYNEQTRNVEQTKVVAKIYLNVAQRNLVTEICQKSERLKRSYSSVTGTSRATR
jgi:hypothetical protein